MFSARAAKTNYIITRGLKIELQEMHRFAALMHETCAASAACPYGFSRGYYLSKGQHLLKVNLGILDQSQPSFQATRQNTGAMSFTPCLLHALKI